MRIPCVRWGHVPGGHGAGVTRSNAPVQKRTVANILLPQVRLATATLDRKGAQGRAYAQALLLAFDLQFNVSV